MTSTDQRRESAIALAHLALLAASTPEAQRKRLADLERLVKGRSPEAVRELERDRGLN